MAARAFPTPGLRRTTALAACSLLLVAGLPAAAAAQAGVRAGGTQHAPGAGAARLGVETAYADYELAGEKVAFLGAQSARLAADADAATELASRLHDQVSGEGAGLRQALGHLVGGETDLDRAAQAAADAESSRALAELAATALDEAIAASEDARLRWERARRQEQRLEAQWTAREAADAAIRRAAFQPGYHVADPTQDRRNRVALNGWHRYLDELAAAAVVPPRAASLVSPRRLRHPLEPVLDRRGDGVRGVARIDPRGAVSLTVLPSETVRAVSEAFRRVGLREVPRRGDPAGYACGGLLAHAWAPTLVTLPADAVGQWRELRPVPRAALQTGDVVVLGRTATGLDQTALYVGGGRLIVADPETGTAGVRRLAPAHVLGVRRATLPAGQTADAPPTGGICGLEPEAPAPTETGALLLPLAPGSYTLSAGFGDAGQLWSSGEHTGQDFAAAIGTPVVAAAAGTVTVEHPGWAGNLVRVDHGGGVETWYAHLSEVDVTPGETVRAGQVIGAVGALGNTTGPHLHLEVRLDGLPVDPAAVLDLPRPPMPPYVNGELPDSALCAATPDGVHRLRCDAAVAFRLLAAGYAHARGSELCLTDSYRSRSGQQDVFRRKPHLAATPGTSVHGWGLAVDLCGGVERFGTAEHDWVLAHGPAYGWVHPSWAGAGGSKPEPWHFEFRGGTA